MIGCLLLVALLGRFVLPDSLDFIYTNQCTFYTQMYQSFKYTLKSLKTL